MLIRQEGGFPAGYSRVVEAGGLEFGLLVLGPGSEHRDSAALERVFLLLGGEAELTWDGTPAAGTARVRRAGLLEEPPSVLHLPAGASVRLVAVGAGAEFSVHRLANPQAFAARLIGPAQVACARLGSPKLGAAADRLIRTAIDEADSPRSNLTMGEVVNQAGCWSSYPPHHHPHPEIYHYRFVPEGGFGYSEEGGQVYKVRHRDTVALAPGAVHPQVAAPGYAMVYVWAMPHLPGNRFRAGSREFEEEHAWLK
jgi:5-deoxy-glucuronate isomerase